MITNFDQPIIGYYSPISSKGGKRKTFRRIRKHKRSQRNKSKSKSNKSRTRRYY